MCKGGSSGQTTTSSNQPPPQVLQAYQDLINRGTNVANTPLQQYPTGGPGAPNLVAGFTPAQNEAFSTIEGAQGLAQPYIDTAAQYATAGAAPVYPNLPQFSSANVNQYLSPYTQDVVNATTAQLNKQNAEQQNQLKGNAISAGAWGGDRAGVAQAELAGQQQTAEAPVIAGLYNQGYGQALGEFNTQQQTALNAMQSDAWRQAQAAYQFGGLGAQAQQEALGGAGALLQAGGLQQQLAQEQLNVPYEQFLQQQAYPFQTTQFLGNLVEGAGSGMGGTSQTTTPGPSTLSQVAGLGLTGAAMYALLSDRRAKEDIQLIGKALDGQKIYRFRYKGDPRTHIGFLAQEVEKKHPDAVGERDGIKYVDYRRATEDAARRKRAAGGLVPDVSISYVPTMGLSAARGMGLPAPPAAPQQKDQTAGLSSIVGSLLSKKGNSPAGLGAGWFGSQNAAENFARNNGIAFGSDMSYGSGMFSTPSAAESFAGANGISFAPEMLAAKSGGRIHRASGGMTPMSMALDPMTQILYKRFASMTPEKLREASVYTPEGSPQGRILRQVLAQRNAVTPPVTMGDVSSLPGVSPTPTPSQGLGANMGYADGGDVDPEDVDDGADLYGSSLPAVAAMNAPSIVPVPRYADASIPPPKPGLGAAYNTAPASSEPMPSDVDDDADRVEVPDDSEAVVASGGKGLAAGPDNTASPSEARNLGLLAAGLGIMAGRSPNAMQNIGAGGLAGLKTYAGVKQQEANQAIAQRKANIEDAREKTLESHYENVDARPVVDHSGPTTRVFYPSETDPNTGKKGLWLDTGIPTTEAERNAETTRFHNAEIGVRQQAADQGRYTLQPGMGADPNDPSKEVPGAYKINTKTGEAEFQPGVTLTGRGGTSPALDPQTVDYIAEQYRRTGKMPPLGYGTASVGLRSQVLARAAQMNHDEGGSPSDDIAAQAYLKAGTSGLTKVVGYRNMVESFEQTADKNADMALSMMDKGAGPSGSPILNRWVQYGRKEIAGDPDVTAFNAALTTFKNEYAKIMSGQTGAAGTSDSARAEADELINNSMTPDQIRKTIQTMKMEMENRRTSLIDQENKVREGLRRTGTIPATSPATPAAEATTGKPSAAPAIPALPSNLPAGSLYSPSRKMWRDPSGKLYDAGGNPVGP